MLYRGMIQEFGNCPHRGGVVVHKTVLRCPYQRYREPLSRMEYGHKILGKHIGSSHYHGVQLGPQ